MWQLTAYFDNSAIHMTSIQIFDALTNPVHNFTYAEGHQYVASGISDEWSMKFTATPFTNTANTTYEFVAWEYRIGSETAALQYSTDNPFTYSGGADIYIRAIGKSTTEGGSSSGTPYYIDCYFTDQYIQTTTITNDTTGESWSGNYGDEAFTEAAGNGINISDGSSVTFQAFPTDEGEFFCWAYRIGGDSGELIYCYDNPFTYTGGEKIIIRAMGEDGSENTGGLLIPEFSHVSRNGESLALYFKPVYNAYSYKVEAVDSNGVVVITEGKVQTMITDDGPLTAMDAAPLYYSTTYSIWVTLIPESSAYQETRTYIGKFTTRPPAVNVTAYGSRGALIYGEWCLAYTDVRISYVEMLVYLKSTGALLYACQFENQVNGEFEFEAPYLDETYTVTFKSWLDLSPDKDSDNEFLLGDVSTNNGYPRRISITTSSDISEWIWTSAVRNALLNNGVTTALTYTEWNEFVNFVGEKTGEDVIAALMSESDKVMTAERFNIIRQAIGSHIMFRDGANSIREYILTREGTLDGDWNMYAGEIVKGQYFIDLATYINQYLTNSG